MAAGRHSFILGGLLVPFRSLLPLPPYGHDPPLNDFNLLILAVITHTSFVDWLAPLEVPLLSLSPWTSLPKTMPHPHHADQVMRRAPVRREVIPPHRLPFLVHTVSQDTQTPALVARAPNGSGPASSSGGEKPTSNLTTTVLPVVLGAGYVAFDIYTPAEWVGAFC